MSLPESPPAPTPKPAPAPNLRAPLLRANARFMLSHPAHLIALGFGCGLSPAAPGTVGTLWAWASFLVVQAWFAPSDLAWGLALLVALPISWWACTMTARHMRVLDPGQVVIDEIVAFWAVLWLVMPVGFAAQLVAFVLFRALDMVKPGPIAWADEVFARFGWRHGGWPNGWGILFDDLMAAFGTVLLIALARVLWP